MKTRKRTLSAANSSSVSATVTQNTTSRTRYSPADCWLRQNGFVQVPIANHINGTLAVAVKAFQAQLEVFSEQSPRHRHVGFKQLAKKQRLEFRAGDTALGQLGLLQDLATTVVETLDDMAREQLQSLEKSLQLPAGAFSAFLDSKTVKSSKQSASSLEAIHYTLPEGAAAQLGSLEACEAHEDKGMLTVIYADTAQGLQVQRNDGTWTELPLSGGHVAILAGHTLERATCGLIKAAKHKVVVGAPGGCPTARNALVYKLRAPDTAVLDLYAPLSKHHSAIPPRYQSSIGVGELMHFFDATHTSVNALPAPAIQHGLQPTVISTKKAKTEIPLPFAPSTNSSQGVQLQVVVMAQDGLQVEFKILSTTPLWKVFQAFCLRLGVSRSESVFSLDGDRLWDDWTAEESGLEDKDVIDYVVTQVGD